MAFSKDILQIKDVQNIKKSLEDFIREQTFEKFRKRGIVVGISGGIDSAVVAALACNAVGKEKVLGIILPEKESNTISQEFAIKLCKKLEIEYIVDDITDILVSEGEKIESGQVLFHIANKGAEAELSELGIAVTSLELRKIRLQAERNENTQTVEFPEKLEKLHPVIAESERKIFEARQAEINEKINCNPYGQPSPPISRCDNSS